MSKEKNDCPYYYINEDIDDEEFKKFYFLMEMIK